MRGIVFDLEMNQPSGSIFQIGAVLCDFRKKTVLTEFNVYCKLPFISLDGTREVLSTEVAQLCNIHEKFLNEQELEQYQALESFWTFVQNSNCGCWISSWGKDYQDLLEASETLAVSAPDKLKVLDLKEMAAIFRTAHGGKTRGGLVNTLSLYSIPFCGTPHDAVSDSRSTAHLLFHWISLIEKIHKIEDIFGIQV